ncbi:MAG: elongation factor Ts [Parcubacteria group bacterium QH_9_35_7]|nr:MAG: elongation factor Ts [Parcubacteria group bacterium QH_9_35_7]
MSSTEEIKKLRSQTGAGMMNCKEALEEADGDMEEAKEILRKKGIAEATEQGGTAAEGRVASYIHGDGDVGVLVEINTETDFTAKNDEFKELVKDVAMHIAAINPDYVAREDVPQEVIEEEQEVYAEQMRNQGKPEDIIDDIVEGKMDKFYSKVCLMEQEFVKDEDKTIEELVKEKAGEIGENIQVRRFVRYEVGEGIETESEDFAEEVEEQL